MTSSALMEVAQSLGVHEIIRTKNLHTASTTSPTSPGPTRETNSNDSSFSSSVEEAWKEFWGTDGTDSVEGSDDIEALLADQDFCLAALSIWCKQPATDKLPVGSLLAPYSYTKHPSNPFQLDASLAHHLLQQQPQTPPQPPLQQQLQEEEVEEDESSSSSSRSSNSSSSSSSHEDGDEEEEEEDEEDEEEEDLVEEEMEELELVQDLEVAAEEEELVVEMQQEVVVEEEDEDMLQRLTLDDHPYFPDQTDHSMIPSTIAVSQILRIINYQLQQSVTEVTNSTVQNGIGYALFAPPDNDDQNNNSNNNEKSEEKNLRCLVMLLQYLATQRNDALNILLKQEEEINPVALEYEIKGMKRKAAAAAHVAHLRKEHSIYHQLEYLSTCSYLTLSSIILLLQTTESISPSVTNYLTSILETSFMGCRITDYSKVKENHIMTLPLLYLSSKLWAELLPIKQDSEHLISLIQSCRNPSTPYHPHLIQAILQSAVENKTPSTNNTLDLVPWTDVTLQYLKCEALCDRLRVRHNLEQLISKPITSTDIHESPKFPNALLKELFSTISQPNSYYNLLDSNLHRLFLALSHHIHKSILLWDDVSLTLNTVNASESKSTNGAMNNSDDGSALHIISNPTGFELDGTKCSDSIAIVSSDGSNGNLFSANQRASKVWGTVVSQKIFQPKSGVHRWAVQLDRCERGHVFVGVASSLVSTKTYVGGDKNGWGVIGTQALWHDRTKLRGDYGGTFRTGSTVVVTLDTDVGTLSFGLWKHKINQLEDWGIAFEGLPLDVKLYPAVGLYQRDDKVTLLGISSHHPHSIHVNNSNSSHYLIGECYFPRIINEETELVREYNSELNRLGLNYTKDILANAISLLEESSDNLKQHALFQYSLPSLASCLSILPSSIPILSGTVAMALLPLVLKLLKMMKHTIEEEEEHYPNTMDGKWIIRATSSVNSTNNTSTSNGSDIKEEYVVILKTNGNYGFKGDGIGTNGRSTNGHVDIVGTIRGSSLQFVEEWTDHGSSHSSCVIDARIYDTKFEGTYRNVQYGTSGMIAGVRCDDNKRASPTYHNMIHRNRHLLGLAAHHLIRILSSGAPMEDVSVYHPQNTLDTSEMTKLLMESSILSSPWICTEPTTVIKTAIQSIQNLYFDKNDVNFLYYNKLFEELLQFRANHEKHSSKGIMIPSDLDSKMQSVTGGCGSLSPLNPHLYTSARKTIISVLLYHAGLQSLETEENKLMPFWQKALQIMETGLRKQLSHFDGSKKDGCEKFCSLVESISSLLLQKCRVLELSEVEMLAEISKIYSWLTEVEWVQKWETAMTRQGILKYIGQVGIYDLLQQGNFLEYSVSIDTCPGALQQIQSCVRMQHDKICTFLEERLSHFLELCDKRQQPIYCAKEQSKLLVWTNEYLLSSKYLSSHLIEKLFQLLKSCKTSLSCETSTEKGYAQVEEIALLTGAASHYCNRVIIRSILSIFHVTLYHQNHIELISSMLEEEIKDTIHMIHEQCQIQVKQNKKKWVKTDYEKIFDADSRDEKLSTKTTTTSPLGVQYILEHGSSMTQIPKGSTTSSEYLTSNLHGAEDYLTHLLNAFSSLLQTKNNMNQLNSSLIILLMDSVCSDDVILPVRFKIRILRMLRSVLPVFESNENILRQLLFLSDLSLPSQIKEYHSPDASSDHETTEMDKFLVAKEAVSLLRIMYHQSTEWRNLLHASYPMFVQEEGLRQGLVAFLGGIPGRIIKGSFVLLKPSMASSLSSNMSSSSSSTKSQTSSGGSPPVIVGSGMEGVVTGLCRFHAMAGMISQLDIISNSCEVILFERDNDSTTTMANSGKHHTVRAVRAPLSDVVSADEIPFVMDNNLPLLSVLANQLHHSLEATQQIMINREEKDSTELYLWNTLSALRSSILLLSDTQSLELFLRNDTMFSKQSLTSLLEIASSNFVGDAFSISNAACLDSLSSMPDLEARFWHLKGMLLSSLIRQNVVQNETLEHIIDYEKEETIEGEEDNHNSIGKEMEQLVDQMEGLITPPASTLSRTSSDATSNNNANSTNANVSEGFRQAANSTSTAAAGATTTTGNSMETATEEEDDDDEENGADEATRLHEETAAAHLREAAIVQMAELGLPRSWSEYALRRVGGTNIEAAVHFCLERGGDMERLLADERERVSNTGISVSNRRNSAGANHLIRQLIEMGFPSHWCAEALAETGNNVDEALTWILTNGERLSAVDEGNEEGVEDENDDDDDDDDDEDDENHSTTNPDISDTQNTSDTLTTAAMDNSSTSSPINKEHDFIATEEVNAINNVSSSPTSDHAFEKDLENNDDEIMEESIIGWDPNIICPVRTISGRANIDKDTLEITGLPSGGFSSGKVYLVFHCHEVRSILVWITFLLFASEFNCFSWYQGNFAYQR